MAINFYEKGYVVSTIKDGTRAIKPYSLEKQIYYLKSQLRQKEDIINTFDTFIKEVYNRINLGDENEEFILVLDKWLELNGDGSNE